MIRAELNQDLLRGGQRFTQSLLKKVLHEVNRSLNIKTTKQISIVFVNAKTMQRLNGNYRGKDRVTDVLSFNLGDDPFLGEIVISYDQARRQALELKHPVRNEIVFLIVHGLLHLLGHDHDQPSDAKKMFAIQEKILDRLHVNPQL